MQTFRNGRFTRWVASGLAVTWLFTVLTCAVDPDAVAADESQGSQLATPAEPAVDHHPDGDDHDVCCDVQANAIVSSSAVKPLPGMTLTAIVPAAALFTPPVLGMSVRVPAIPDRDRYRRRSELLIHSLQAQAPPR